MTDSQTTVQVDELREAAVICDLAREHATAKLFREAVYTIESLRDRLQAATLGSDEDYEAKMDALLSRLTNGKFSKSRTYDLDFMVSCVDEEYEELYEKERAELGSGTCVVTHDFNCSNCGKQIGVVRNCEMYETCDGQQAWKSLDHEVCDIPNFCSNCGAKVVSK